MSETDRPRVAVAGTRTLDNRKLVFDTLDRLTAKLKKPIILTGGGWFYTKDARGFPVKVGADVFAEEWAFSHYHTLMKFHPDFDRYKAPEALHIRTREMVEFLVGRRPCYAVAFHDGKSPGTLGFIKQCKRLKVDHLAVIRVKCPAVPTSHRRR